MEINNIKNKIPAWVEQVNNPNAARHPYDLSLVTKAIFTYLPYDLKELNSCLEMINPDIATGSYLNLVLRTTSSFKGNLPYWETLKIKTYHALIEKSLNADLIMQGLFT
jgi:hypothetical protein